MPNIQKMTAKELAIEMNISLPSAKRLYRDLKNHYEIKVVTMSHVIHYLKIPTAQPL